MNRLTRLNPLMPLLWTIIFIVGAAPAAGEPIYGLNGEVALFIAGDAASEEPPELCMAHEFSVPGQGLHVSGSSMASALVRDPTSVFGAAAQPVMPTVRQATDAQFQELIEAAEQSVVILVVDDFGEIEGAGLEPTSHGDLVMEHLEALVDSILGAGDKSSSDGEIRWTTAGNAELIVVPVDVTGAASTDAIAAEIDKAFYAMMEREVVARVVINMSWVLLPCAVIDAFDPSEYENYEMYVDALTVANEPLTKSDLFRTMATPWEHDPLLATLESLDGAYVVPVAAAGNFGLPFQMLPAAWEWVIGVSATPGPPDYSNMQGVLAKGGWYTTTSGEGAYAGTSFSAPLVALFIALDLMSESPRCTDLTDRLPRLQGPSALEVAIETC